MIYTYCGQNLQFYKYILRYIPQDHKNPNKNIQIKHRRESIILFVDGECLRYSIFINIAKSRHLHYINLIERLRILCRDGDGEIWSSFIEDTIIYRYKIYRNTKQFMIVFYVTLNVA